MRPWLILFAAVGMSIGVAIGLGALGWLVSLIFGQASPQAYVLIYLVCLFAAIVAIHWTWAHRRDIPRLLRGRWRRGKMIRSEFER